MKGSNEEPPLLSVLDQLLYGRSCDLGCSSLPLLFGARCSSGVESRAVRVMLPGSFLSTSRIYLHRVLMLMVSTLSCVLVAKSKLQLV